MIVTTVAGKKFEVPVEGCIAGLRAITIELDAKDIKKLSELTPEDLHQYVGHLTRIWHKVNLPADKAKP